VAKSPEKALWSRLRCLNCVWDAGIAGIRPEKKLKLRVNSRKLVIPSMTDCGTFPPSELRESERLSSLVRHFIASGSTPVRPACSACNSINYRKGGVQPSPMHTHTYIGVNIERQISIYRNMYVYIHIYILLGVQLD